MGLAIKDSGRGIPSEVLPKLMRKGETYHKEGGTGLGLYHAKSSVESWGGTIELFSEVGQGTEVRVSLPRVQSRS